MKPIKAPTVTANVGSIGGLIFLAATNFPERADFIEFDNTLGAVAYDLLAPTFRVNQNGVFLENVRPKCAMRGATSPTDPKNFTLYVPMDWHNPDPAAPYHTDASFTVKVTYIPDKYWITDEFLNPIYQPCYVVEIS